MPQNLTVPAKPAQTVERRTTIRPSACSNRDSVCGKNPSLRRDGTQAIYRTIEKPITNWSTLVLLAIVPNKRSVEWCIEVIDAAELLPCGHEARQSV